MYMYGIVLKEHLIVLQVGSRREAAAGQQGPSVPAEAQAGHGLRLRRSVKPRGCAPELDRPACVASRC